MAGSEAAMHYGYSSARVKAMESKLIAKKQMQEIINAKDAGAIISILFQGDFKKDLEEFGGLEIKSELIDFALSKNLGKNVTKLVQIAPSTEKKLIRAIAGKWNIYNVKIAIEGKERRMSFDQIARYIVDYGRYDSAFIKEAMREDTIDGMLAKFMINSPYAGILKDGQDAYKKSKSGIDAVAAIDKSYYKLLGNVIIGLRIVDNSAARIVKMDIDMKNLIYMIKAKRAAFKFADIQPNLIESGNMPVSELEQVYNGSRDIESMVAQAKLYDMKDAIDVYKSGKSRQLLVFEIGIRNSIFSSSMKLLNHSILSFGAILAYSYMKEIEIFTLRILINSKMYGLSKEETSRLIVWKNE